MKMALDCAACFVRQATEAVKLAESDPARREQLLRQVISHIAEMSWEGSPPALAQQLHRLIREVVGDDDPYRAIKEELNTLTQSLLPAVQLAIAQQIDTREATVRIAIAGNMLNMGARSIEQTEAFPRYLQTIWDQPMAGDINELFRAAEGAHCILYLADNAGEIFFDRLLIEALPAEKITLAVRGAPALNDALMKDAEAAKLFEVVPIIDNGSDAPGTVLSQVSEEFRYWYDRADLIIAKGQGNYETLSDTDKHTFFLLTVKCPVIAEHIDEPVGHLVVKEVGMG